MSESDLVRDLGRRNFFKTSLGVAALSIAPGFLLFDIAHGKAQPSVTKCVGAC
jgi:hypothetical protein